MMKVSRPAHVNLDPNKPCDGFRVTKKIAGLGTRLEISYMYN